MSNRERFEENVRRLYEEAAAKCNTNQAWEWERKFAEQIIKDACQHLTNIGQDYCRERLEQHFGVE